MTEILDEGAVSGIEAQINSGSLILPLRVDHWHMSLTSGGWYIKNASDRIVMTVAFVPVELETGKPALDGNAPARHTAALLNSIPALCATVKYLRAEITEYEGVEGRCKAGHNKKFTYLLNDLPGCVACERDTLQSQLEQLRAGNVSIRSHCCKAEVWYYCKQCQERCEV